MAAEVTEDREEEREEEEEVVDLVVVVAVAVTEGDDEEGRPLSTPLLTSGLNGFSPKIATIFSTKSIF